MESTASISSSTETLAIPPNASLFEAKRAYRSLAKVWHPDRFIYQDDHVRRDAEEKMKEINEAYHTFISSFSSHHTHSGPRGFREERRGFTGEAASPYGQIQAQIRAKEKAEARRTFYIMSFLMVGGLSFLTLSSVLIWWLLPYAMYFVYG